MPLMNRVGCVVIGLLLGLSADGTAADVVVVVSAQNPVTTLSKNQVVDIFLGKTSQFPDGSRAVPVDQVEDSTARNAFYVRFAGKSRAQLKAHWSKIIFTGRGQPPKEVADSAEVKKLIIDNPNAIGYIEQGMVDGSVKVLLAQ